MIALGQQPYSPQVGRDEDGSFTVEYRLVANYDVAFLRLEETGNGPEQGGLSGSRRAKQRQKLSRFHFPPGFQSEIANAVDYPAGGLKSGCGIAQDFAHIDSRH